MHTSRHAQQHHAVAMRVEAAIGQRGQRYLAVALVFVEAKFGRLKWLTERAIERGEALGDVAREALRRMRLQYRARLNGCEPAANVASGTGWREAATVPPDGLSP